MRDMLAGWTMALAIIGGSYAGIAAFVAVLAHIMGGHHA